MENITYTIEKYQDGIKHLIVSAFYKDKDATFSCRLNPTDTDTLFNVANENIIKRIKNNQIELKFTHCTYSRYIYTNGKKERFDYTLRWDNQSDNNDDSNIRDYVLEVTKYVDDIAVWSDDVRNLRDYDSIFEAFDETTDKG